MISKNSLRLGRLFGIEVALDPNWFLIAIILIFSLSQMARQDMNMATGAAFSFGILTTLLLFGSVLAHEYGHALTARAFGINTRRIVLFLFGGVALVESEPKRPVEELWITVAGPAVSLFLGISIGALVILADGLGVPNPLVQMLVYLAAVNIVLAVFNCLPGFPMDGGRLLRATVWAITGSFFKATKVASWSGIVVGGLIFVWGLVSLLLLFAGVRIPGSILLLFLGPFLSMLAWRSLKYAEILSLLEDVRVGDVMRPVRAVVPSGKLLSEIVPHYFQFFGGDHLPVVDGDRLLGYISAEDVMGIPQRQWDWTRVDELVRPYEVDKVLAPEVGASAALQQLQQHNRAAMAVFEGRRLLGFVFHNDLIEMLRNKQRSLVG